MWLGGDRPNYCFGPRVMRNCSFIKYKWIEENFVKHKCKKSVKRQI